MGAGSAEGCGDCSALDCCGWGAICGGAAAALAVAEPGCAAGDWNAAMAGAALRIVTSVAGAGLGAGFCSSANETGEGAIGGAGATSGGKAGRGVTAVAGIAAACSGAGGMVAACGTLAGAVAFAADGPTEDALRPSPGSERRASSRRRLAISLSRSLILPEFSSTSRRAAWLRTKATIAITGIAIRNPIARRPSNAIFVRLQWIENLCLIAERLGRSVLHLFCKNHAALHSKGEILMVEC